MSDKMELAGVHCDEAKTEFWNKIRILLEMDSGSSLDYSTVPSWHLGTVLSTGILRGYNIVPLVQQTAVGRDQCTDTVLSRLGNLVYY